MTRTAVLSACIVASIAGAAQAATVEFRIVERRGQVAWTGTAQPAGTNDAILNFSVLARVVGGVSGEALGNFGFDLVSNDATGNGAFTKALISNADGTYAPSTTYSNNATVGRGGLARPYSYLAGISPEFNGVINMTSGSFIQNPLVEDLGLITGSPTGQALLDVADTDFDGLPDTYPGSGTTAPLDPALGSAYFGATGFVAVYNFNYTIASNAIRTITFSVANAQAQTFLSLAVANGVWGPANPQNATTLASGALVAVTPAPGAAALLGLGGLMVARRRRVA